MYLPESGLPLTFEPFADESGLGYCLRVLSRNGTDFHGLRRLLGIAEVTPISRVHAYETAKLLQVSIPWLEGSLPESYKARAGVHVFFGHQLFAHNHLRMHSPQVCAQCIHRYGYCRAIWELSLATVCLEHGRTLTSRCHECGQPLRWDRPSIDVGHCGHYIKFAPDQPNASADLMDWQKLVQQKLSSDDDLINAEPLNWQRTLRPMTLGGMFMIVTAFGIMKGAFMPINSAVSTKKLIPNEWQAIILRAIPRLCTLYSGRDGDDLSGLVSQHLLLRLLKADVATIDQQTALSQLKKIFSVEVDRHLLGQYPHLGQQQLF